MRKRRTRRRKEERRRSSVSVKKTELYSSLDATTIEIFFTEEEDIVMEKEEVSHRFIFDSEGSHDPVGIEIKAGRDEEKFTFDLRKHHPVRTDQGRPREMREEED